MLSLIDHGDDHLVLVRTLQILPTAICLLFQNNVSPPTTNRIRNKASELPRNSIRIGTIIESHSTQKEATTVSNLVLVIK